MIKAIAYFRVSTDKQGDRGLGMQAQEHAVKQYIEGHGVELVESYREVESGKNNNRPEFHKAMEHCARTGATLLIAKLDRLSRNVRFISELLENESFDFVALDMPQASRFEFHIRAALAEEEARLISERTKAGLARSTKPLGAANPIIRAKALAKRRELAAAFNETLRPMVELIRGTSDTISYLDVSRQLNKIGRKTRTGKPWTYSTVKRLFETV